MADSLHASTGLYASKADLNDKVLEELKGGAVKVEPENILCMVISVGKYRRREKLWQMSVVLMASLHAGPHREWKRKASDDKQHARNLHVATLLGAVTVSGSVVCIGVCLGV